MLEELRWKILDNVVKKRWYSKRDIVEAKDIAQEINIGLDYVHEELEKMEYLGLVELIRTAGPTYAVMVTPEGLLVHEQAGKDEKES
jgi:Mn-dependent DtxR family transcriptional regulator